MDSRHDRSGQVQRPVHDSRLTGAGDIPKVRERGKARCRDGEPFGRQEVPEFLPSLLIAGRRSENPLENGRNLVVRPAPVSRQLPFDHSPIQARTARVRIGEIVHPDRMTQTGVDHVKVHFRLETDGVAELGVGGEGIERFGMVALDVPPEVDLAKVQRLLDHGVAQGWWDMEEGCITDAWRAARAR